MREILLTVAAIALAAPSIAQTSNRPAVLSAAGGRYVFGQINDSVGHQYLLDTQTGRLWTFITYCEDVLKKETCDKPLLRAVHFDATPSSERGGVAPGALAPLPAQATIEQPAKKK